MRLKQTTLPRQTTIYENQVKVELLSIAGSSFLRREWSQLTELLLRFAIGGIVVSTFSAIGSVLRPKTFAGFFGAAHSVALATLALTFHKDGHAYAALEGRSMLLRAVAMAVYAWVVAMILFRARPNTLLVTSTSLLTWFVVAFGLWFVLAR